MLNILPPFHVIHSGFTMRLQISVFQASVKRCWLSDNGKPGKPLWWLLNASLPSKQFHKSFKVSRKFGTLAWWASDIEVKHCLLLMFFTIKKTSTSQSGFLWLHKTWQRCLAETDPPLTELSAAFMPKSCSLVVFHPLAWCSTIYF